MNTPLNIGVIGTTGYPAQLIQYFNQFIPHDTARIAAVDDSMSQPNEKTAAILESYGTQRIKGVEPLMDHNGLDIMLVATSIDSHLPFTEMALQRGLAVHCEKPVTATIEDAQQMIAARDAAGLPVQVGYQETWSTSLEWAKQQILEGVIGPIKRVRLQARWPRTDSYYGRNNWAGAIQRDGRWALDSPANNALAHQINQVLYVTGPDADSSNTAIGLEAELYRARDIANYDTAAIRCQTAAGCEILILLTHACSKLHGPVIEYIGEKGLFRRFYPRRFELEVDGKIIEAREDDDRGGSARMLENLIARVRGKAARSKCEIENAAEVVRVINGSSQCARVQSVDAAHLKQVAPREDKPDDLAVTITDIESVFDRCFRDHKLPSELGDIAWAKPASRIDLKGYTRFGGVPTGA